MGEIMNGFVQSLSKRKLAAPLAIALVVAVAGVGIWVAELIGAAGGIGTDDATPWGAYLMVFIFFVGLGTGSAILSSLATVFRMKALEPFVVPGIIMAVAFVATAGLAIVMDLGNPGNILAMLAGLNLRSMLAWDMIALTVFLVVTVVAYIAAVRSGGSMPRGLGVAVLAAAVFLLAVDALLFQVQAAREPWHSAVIVPWFFSTALTSAAALFMLVGILDARHDARLAASNAPLSKILLALVCIDLAFLVVDVLYGVSSSNAGDSVVSGAMLLGGLAPWFWGQVVLYVASIALLAGPAAKEPGKAGALAAILVLVGVLCKRADFILGGFFEPNLAQPVAEGIASAATGVSYAPTWSELAICVGFFAMAAFLAIVGTAMADQPGNSEA